MEKCVKIRGCNIGYEITNFICSFHSIEINILYQIDLLVVLFFSELGSRVFGS